MILMPAMNSALHILLYLLPCIYYHVYFTHTIDIFFDFFQLFMFLEKYIYLILNRHECNFQLQILRFLKSVLHPFMLFTSAFHNRTCPD